MSMDVFFDGSKSRMSSVLKAELSSQIRLGEVELLWDSISYVDIAVQGVVE